MRVAELTPQEFSLTFMTICELSLFAPLFPTSFSMRASETSISDLHPLSRFLKVLDAAVELGHPIKDLAKDYSLFVHDVCSKLKYPTPYDISVNTIKSLAFRQDDVRAKIYGISHELRCACPWVFIDLDVWSHGRSRGSGETEQKLRYYFTHPVMEFRDRVIYHKDKGVVEFFHDAYVLHMYLNNLMLSDDVTVTMPYRVSKNELVYYESRLKKQLETGIGLESPRVMLMSRATET